MKRKNDKVIKKLNEILDMPKEVISNVPKLTITGFQELLVENYKEFWNMRISLLE